MSGIVADTDELRLIRQSTATIAARYGQPYFAARARSGGGIDELWTELGDAGLLGAGAHQAGVGARARGQAQCVQDDRLARAGFAGKRGQARPERQVEGLDQNDVADSEPDQG